VNDIYHHYDSDKRKTVLHVVTCEEEWHEIDKITGREVTMTSDHARISDKPLNRLNVHKRGNPAARHRQGIESGFSAEKHQGCHYEHCFSYNRQAVIGDHYLMRSAHICSMCLRNIRRVSPDT